MEQSDPTLEALDILKDSLPTEFYELLREFLKKYPPRPPDSADDK